MTISIVTDSACDVPEELAREKGITVVPVYVNTGDRSYLEGVELSREEFYDNLIHYPVYPTTAAPASGAFQETYERLGREGTTEILSIHIASGLSATYNAARLGAESARGVRVTLLDTKQITLGAGLLVLLAAEAVADGLEMDEIVDMLNQRVKRTLVFGMIDDLTALRRSGRVSWAEFGLGTLLHIKPVMMIHESVVSVAAKIRTRKRAMAQMVNMVEEFGPFERLAIIHVNAPDAALELAARAKHMIPQDHPSITAGIGPAIGTHLGLGAVGFACISSSGTE
jgi:DegV family protein with EDD domain